MKIVKVKIRVETDYDFTLNLPKNTSITKMIYRGYLYKINLFVFHLLLDYLKIMNQLNH